MKFVFVIIVLIIAVIIFLRKFFPFMFWSKNNLSVEKFAAWDDIFKGKIINFKKIKTLELSIPQCEKCFLDSFKRKDLRPDTIIDPIYADYNVVSVKVDHKLIFICKKHKIQIKEREYTV